MEFDYESQTQNPYFFVNAWRAVFVRLVPRLRQ